jgi:uncharacterized membrane protein YccC
MISIIQFIIGIALGALIVEGIEYLAKITSDLFVTTLCLAGCFGLNFYAFHSNRPVWALILVSCCLIHESMCFAYQVGIRITGRQHGQI